MSSTASHIQSAELVDKLNFCVIDLETTGGNHEKDRIIEIGLVKVSQREITETKSFLLNPEIKIPDFIQKLTTIKQKDVEDKPFMQDVVDEIIEFIGDDILVAHNISFDIPFLNAVLKRLGKESLENKVICTNVMTKYLIPNITSSNLTYMSQLFKLDHKKAHRALDDAKATARLLIKYLEIFVKKGIKKVNQLYYPKNKFELDRIHFSKEDTEEEIFQFIKSLDTPGHITFKGQQGTIMGIIPSQSFKNDLDIIKDLSHDLDWEILTIKLSFPFLESLLYFCSHYQKLDTQTQKKLVSFLSQKIPKVEQSVSIDSTDFIISNHLIREQVQVYSFLNLNLKNNSIFRVPAQKKKMYQYLLSQANRFDSHQKGKRKHFISKELAPLINSYLSQPEVKKEYLFLDRKSVQESPDEFYKFLDQYTQTIQVNFNYPETHL